jgi:hypothetical protein
MPPKRRWELLVVDVEIVSQAVVQLIVSQEDDLRV